MAKVAQEEEELKERKKKKKEAKEKEAWKRKPGRKNVRKRSRSTG